MQKESNRDLRQALIEAGIEEINQFGANDFSVRRVANACGVSTAAPYKHFKDKKELIGAIIDYVNEQWAVEQDRLLASCADDPRTQMVTVATGYIKFLMEKPYYRQTLMLKNAEFDNLYHRKRGEINSRTEQIMQRVKEAYHLSDEKWERKALMVRSLLFGSVFMFDSGEFEYSEKTLEYLRYIIDREFTVH
ncbi:MAG: TetR/AcrR family transcriptional regulator [Clostridia bacterium]|nr:TetR/AcrR family transcriptional regulator [Clostridia bacterium]